MARGLLGSRFNSFSFVDSTEHTHTFFGPMNVGVKLNLRHFSFVHTFFSSQNAGTIIKCTPLSSWAMDDFDGKNGICIKCVLLLNSIVNDSIQSYLKCICQENIFKRRNKIRCHEQRNHQHETKCWNKRFKRNNRYKEKPPRPRHKP